MQSATKPARSYVHGASSQTLMGETIGMNFDRTASRWPENNALIIFKESRPVRMTSVMKSMSFAGNVSRISKFPAIFALSNHFR